MKLQILLALTLFSTIQLSAQTPLNKNEKVEWELNPTLDVTSFTDVFGFSNLETAQNLSFRNSIIKTDDENYALVRITKSKKLSVVCFTGLNNEKWRSELDGEGLILCKFNSNILAVTSSKFQTYNGYSNTLTAWLFEPATGKLIKKYDFYKGQEDFREEHSFLPSTDGSWFKFAVRKTGLKKKFQTGLVQKLREDFYRTQEFTVYSLNPDISLTEPTRLALPKWNF